MTHKLLVTLFLFAFLTARDAKAQPPTPPSGAAAAVALRSEIDLDEIDVEADTDQIKQERAKLRADHIAYDKALHESGGGSLQAHAAKQARQDDRAVLHKDLQARLNDLKAVRSKKSQLVRLDVRELARMRRRIDEDMKSLSIDRAEVTQDRAALRGARQGELYAIAHFGKDSSQAQRAEMQVDHSLIILHEELGDLRQDAKETRKDERAAAK